ncbi:MAG: nucleoside-diphosphate kinase [Candidatus Margulisbacteria bacterium]|nr:nucleoside-diphosphate kinase [Candidatus Margulisiibacteriota bacterium]
MVEQTFIFIKPDGVERGLSETILQKFTDNNFKILHIKELTLTKEMADIHYNEHVDKPFYPDLLSFITRGPIIAAIMEKENAVEEARVLVGATNPAEAEEGTIRKEFGKNTGENVIHASDSEKSAESEIQHFFPDYVT